jgi:inner membrane protein
MDNVTHTLVGAALAEAGLKKRTPLAAATLMLAANFPDIDVYSVALKTSLPIRRGITHGIPAHIILPFVLAWLVWLYDARVRRRRDPSLPAADFKQLLLLSAIGIATHPFLDFMNIYGMRWLMPIVNKWFYGDVLFIVDVWVWLALGAGVIWARRAKVVWPARAALGWLAVYIVTMFGITTVGRARVAKSVNSAEFMVGPTPFVPWHRDIIVDEPTRYVFGRWSLGGDVVLTGETLAKGAADPAVAIARETQEARAFLSWSRYPFYRVVQEGGATYVRFADARYMGETAKGWAAVEVRLP